MKLGKILIMVVLAMSIVFVGWAAALFRERLNWAPPWRGEVKAVNPETGIVTVSFDPDPLVPPGSTLVIYRKGEFLSAIRLSEVRTGEYDGKVIAGAPIDQIKVKDQVAGGGQITDLEARIAKLVPLRDKAEAQWLAAQGNLLKAEKSRSAYKQWYKEQLALLETGMDRDGKAAAIQSLEVGKDGLLVMEPEGRKQVKVFDKDAEAFNAYNKKYAELQKEIERTEEEIAKLLEKEKELSIEINGGTLEKDGKKLEILGLRKELAQAQADKKNAEDEKARLIPDTYNSQAEAQLLLKRQQQLRARLKELQGTAEGTAN